MRPLKHKPLLPVILENISGLAGRTTPAAAKWSWLRGVVTGGNNGKMGKGIHIYGKISTIRMI